MQDSIFFMMTSNMSFLLISFIVLLLILHISFVWINNLSKVMWKKIDYLWLGVALLGVVFSFSEIRINLAKKSLEVERQRMYFDIDSMKNSVGIAVQHYMCMDFIKSQMPPSDFNERIEKYKITCKWVKDVSEILQEIEIKKFPDINFDIFPTFNLREPTYILPYKNLLREMKNYQENRSNYIELKENVTENNFDIFVKFFGPFLLLFALALRMTKVSGEIRHEKIIDKGIFPRAYKLVNKVIRN